MSFVVRGTGMSVPDHVVTNHDLAKLVDTSDEWITQRVGVRQRHICTTETATDLACLAAERALENGGCKPEELDLIIAATISGDTVSPSVACMVQKHLGATCMAFDINAACSAFVFLLEIAAGFFARGFQNILVIGTERMSRIIDWSDRSTCVIFGDGAGAALLRAGEGYLCSTFSVKGDDQVIKIPHYAGTSPFWNGPVEPPYIRMNGQETFKYAVSTICSDVQTLLEKSGLTLNDIAYIVPHQANKRIIDFASQKLKVAPDKFYVNIERYGNTSSASIPIALDEMNRQGLLRRGDKLLLTAFGGGLASGSCILEW